MTADDADSDGLPDLSDPLPFSVENQSWPAASTPSAP
jgi:hypothetical protein